MAQGVYKNGEKINLTYQAIGGLSNAIPVSKIYNSANASDAAKQSVLNSAMLANQKVGGRYLGYFTPDTTGRWTVCIQDKNGDGLVSKTYEVGSTNLDSVVSNLLVKQSAINAATASDLLLLQSTIQTKLTAETSDFKSALLVAQSAINVATASDLLLLQSTLATKLAAETSDLKSALLVNQSAVISSVLVELVAASSPAMVS